MHLMLHRRNLFCTGAVGRGTRTTHSTSAEIIRRDLRVLLRESAQPVAVVTSLMPDAPQHATTHTHARFHGATLSSFSSIAMDPYPLVAFSLRIPSRMATSLKNAHSHLPSHMVVNILSAAQRATAVTFSRVDLYPTPFAETPYFLTEEGLPVIEGSLGALSCKLVASSWPLHDLQMLEKGERKDTVWEGDGTASELFLAKVIRVESIPPAEGISEDLHTLPLLYHQRTYRTTCDIPPSPPAR